MSSKNAPSAERLYELDAKCIWHPFTPMQAWLDSPDEPGRIIVSGEGFELIDARGRRYIDGFSSLWCNLHGHRVEKIDQAIRDQLDKIAHSTLLGHASAASIELARRLVKITPETLSKVFFSDSGATAVEIAQKIAFQYYRNRGESERRSFIAVRQGYHGDTIGAVSVGGMDTFHSIFGPLLFETTFIDSPNPFHHPAGNQAGREVCRQLEQILVEQPGKYCAVIVEPLIQGAGGMLTHTPGFLADVRRLTAQNDTLLIVDEVATGFCRTGKMFACEHENVEPDLMCLGKGLTGGYLPVAATLASDAVFDAFVGPGSESKTFYHGHTFTGNALGCAAGAASIDLIFESNLLDKLPAKVDLIQSKLAQLSDHPNVGDIRQLGCMVGIELVRDRNPLKLFPPELGTGAAVCSLARTHGLIIRPLGDVVVLMPAPAMDTATLERMLDATVAAICEYFDGR